MGSVRSPPRPSRGALTRTSIASCTPASLSCVFAPRHTLVGAHDCARATWGLLSLPGPHSPAGPDVPPPTSEEGHRAACRCGAPRGGARGDAQGASEPPWQEGPWCHRAQSSARRDAEQPGAPDGNTRSRHGTRALSVCHSHGMPLAPSFPVCLSLSVLLPIAYPLCIYLSLSVYLSVCVCIDVSSSINHVFV